MKYRVIQCPNCGNLQSTSSTTTFKCFRCNKSKTINPKSKLGFGVKILAAFDDSAKAALFIQEYTKRLFEKSK
ncbi:hypothetical protein KY335_02595 [Candidatus Woesearchaeota archaeon]|nr:hypothetical protein [Candidatus Woesearchaeota archaeon]MBW3014108.1 hypothetical protein [Candidatus Woesearchaeota archaeon]